MALSKTKYKIIEKDLSIDNQFIMDGWWESYWFDDDDYDPYYWMRVWSVDFYLPESKNNLTLISRRDGISRYVYESNKNNLKQVDIEKHFNKELQRDIKLNKLFDLEYRPTLSEYFKK